MSQILRGNNNQRGISVLEIVIGSAMIAVAFVSVVGVGVFSLSQSFSISRNTQAIALAQEAMEAVRNVRDQTQWNSDGLGVLMLNVAYYPQTSSDNPPRWQMIQGEEQIQGFTRTITFTNALRDGSGNIVEGGGLEDPNTKRVVAAVSWSERGRTHQTTLETYLTNWRQ